MRGALHNEVARLEILVAKFAAMGALAGIAIGAAELLVWPGPGKAVMVASAIASAWFLLMWGLLRAGYSPTFSRWVSPWVETSIATSMVLLATLVFDAIPSQASTTTYPIYLVVILVQVLRLSPRNILFFSAVSAAQYLLISQLVIVPHMSEQTAGELFTLSLDLVRTAVLLTGGALGAMVAHTLSRAAQDAHKKVRSKELFGKYRLGETIGVGGMGEVLRATYCPEGGFERPVALKRIKPSLAQNPSFVASFRREAELSARLTHRNIIQVFDFGRVEDTYFYAMEFVDGLSLTTIMRRAIDNDYQIPQHVVGQIGIEVLAALEFAHTRVHAANGDLVGIVHRDLSPDNIMISRAGEVKIMDFGIARVLDESGQANTQNLMGKPSYIAPELLKGEALSPQTDLFALGVILWECLTLKNLFSRKTREASMMAVLQFEPPEVNSLRNEPVQASWEKFLEKALQKEPSNRFLSARMMRKQLQELVGDLEDTPHNLLAELVARSAAGPSKSESSDTSLQNPAITLGPSSFAQEPTQLA